MELENKKNIQGLFKYDSSVTFTRGDFIVDGVKLYIVKKNSVKGISPSSPEGIDYYETYMGNEVTDSIDDIEAYVKSQGQNKAVSAICLGMMLNSYLSGFDEKGIINNEVNEDGEVLLRDYFNKQSSIEVGEGTNPLDEIMKDKNLNNAIFKVSKEVSRSIMGSLESEVLDYSLLRQYTYVGKGGVKTRVQELVDIESGMSMFRYSFYSNNYETSNPWVSGNVGSHPIEMINSLITHYNTQASKFINEIYSLKSSFRYKRIPFDNDDINSLENTLVLRELEEDDEILATICIYREQDGIIRSTSLTVDLKTTASYKTGDVILKVDVDGSTTYLTTDNGAYIKDIYVKQFFKETDSEIIKDYKVTVKKELKITRNSGSGLVKFYIDLGSSIEKGFVILENQEITTISGRPHNTSINPIVVDLEKEGTTTCYSSSSNGGSCRWSIKREGNKLVASQEIYDINGNQDIGLGDNFQYTMYEEITKAILIPL